jgi:hypothetical protein
MTSTWKHRLSTCFGAAGKAPLAALVFALAFPGIWPLLSRPIKQEPAGKPVEPEDTVGLQMKNVNFLLADNIVLEVVSLRGRLQRTKPDVPVTFDDTGSFTVEIDTGQVAISASSLSSLLNSYVFGYDHAPITNITAATKGDRIVLHGTLHKGPGLPFEIEGSLSTTVEGNIRVHAEKIASAHIPVKGLLHFLGEDLSKLINQNAGRGLRVEGDDVILLPSSLTPPPHMLGRVVRVGITGNKLVQYFDSTRHFPALAPPLTSAGYIYHRGGVLRFGKLTMNDADLEIVGDKPGAFTFFQREYLRQLVAGYSKTTPAKGLIAHMADYSRFAKSNKE